MNHQLTHASWHNMLSALFVLKRYVATCILLTVFTVLYVQIVKIAEVPGITPQDIVDNFVAVTVPAIKQWQVANHSEGLTKKELIGDLLVKLAASVNHISEVMQLINARVYV